MNGSTPAGYYNTPSAMTPGMPGPLLRLKTGTESATPSVNAVISQNLLRLAALLDDPEYRTLARQTLNSFAVEIMQHPFLFVGMLDVIVGLQTGTRAITGVFATAEIPTLPGSREKSQNNPPGSAYDLLKKQLRKETGSRVSSTVAVASLVDIRPSHLKDFVGNQSFWLKSRNPLYKDLKAADPAKNYLLACEAGSCREVDL